MASIIDYAPGDSLFHRLNPITKVAFAISVCMATFFANGYVMLVGLLALVCAVGVYAGIGRKTFSMLGAFTVLALFMFVLQVIIVRDGTPVVAFVTDRGIDTGAHVALRLLTFAMPLMLMLTLTPLTDLANACVSVLHIPYRYAFTITTALRFVPIFSRSMGEIMEAQTARGVEYDSKNPFTRLKLMLPMAAPLLISSVSKADDTALAAEERGFYLRTRESSYRTYPLKGRDVAMFVLCVGVIAMGVAF